MSTSTDSARTRGRKRRRDSRPPTQTALLGVLIVATLASIGFLMLKLYNGVPTTNYEKVFVSTPTLGNLLAHDYVRIGGKRVGQVIDVDVGPDGNPRIELQLDPGTRLPQDTKIKIRANGLLGARFVELTPGTARKVLPEGATIEGDANSYTFGLPEAVDTFDRETRGGLRQVIGKLGQGTLGNGAGLNTSLKLAGTHAGGFDRVMRSILARPDAAARLLPSVRSAVAALDRGSDAAPTFPDAASDAFGPFVSERDATRATLEHAPAALASAQDGLRRGRALVEQVHRFATVAATETLPAAPTAFRELAALLREARGPLRRTTPFLPRLGKVAGVVRTTLLTINPVLPRANEAIASFRPLLDVVGKHACDVIDTAVTLRSMTGFGQAGSGPAGPAMAFRLQAVVPNGADAAGVTDTTGLLERDGYEAPCAYPQREYQQFLTSTPARRKGR